MKNNLKIDLTELKKNENNVKCFYEEQIKNI
jgi:hypothetical protein